MRVKLLIYALPILALAQGSRGLAQTSARLSNYINLYASADNKGASSTNTFMSFVQKLEGKKGSRTDAQFLNQVFLKTHQRFLKNFEEYAAFSETLNKGTYNCLTGTALYALILDQMGYNYQIIETNYHIFLLADTDQGKILFEATDPSRGFVSDKAEIEKRISTYRQNELRQTQKGKTYYRYNAELYNSVSLDQLLGLLHYNLAIEAYNSHDLKSSISHLDKAIQLYNSPRIEEFSRIILLSVMESKLEASVKEDCVRQIQSIRNRKAQVMASASLHQP